MSVAQSAGALPPSRLKLVVRALRHRNYALFFFGQGTSLIGTWMQMIALGWLVYTLTGSELLLGVVGFSGRILTFAAAPIAGVIADRMNRRVLLVMTQSLAMAQAFVLAALTFTGAVQVWHIVALSVTLGLVNAFDIPIRQAFVVEMVDTKEDLPNAIALNSFLVNGAQLVGPSLAGVIIGFTGEAWCFMLNGISFVAVIAALLAMRLSAKNGPRRRGSVFENLKEGFVYASGHMPIRSVLLLVASVSLVALSFPLLMPVFAKDILGGGPMTFGFLMGASGVGAISGAVFLAARPSAAGLERVIAAGSAVFGLTMIAFALSRSLWLSVALLVVIGTGRMIQIAASNSLLQAIVDDDKRGRVMSFYTMAFMGMGTFGSLLLGWLAERFGAPNAVIIGGAASLVATGIFATGLPRMRRALAPVFASPGVATEVAPCDPPARP